MRVEKTEDLQEIVSLVSNAFGYDESTGVADDFPILFSQENKNHLFVKKNEKNKIISHAGTVFTRARVENIEIEVGAIGGVATLEEARGEGLARELVSDCCEDLKEQGAALAFLWTGSHDFYRAMGFELVGRQWTITVPHADRDKLAGPMELENCLYNIKGNREPAQTEGLNLLNQLPLGVVRTPDQQKQLLGIKGARVFTAVNRKDGKLAAYLVINKGLDLPNHVHEWAGDKEALRYLLRFALDTFGCDLHVMTPQFAPHEAPWIYDLEGRGFKTEPGFMAMVKLLDLDKINQLIRGRAESMNLDADICHIYKDKGRAGYTVKWQADKAYELPLDELEFLTFIFGPGLPSQQMQEDPGRMAVLDAIFPLRLWWWGLDSV